MHQDTYTWGDKYRWGHRGYICTGGIDENLILMYFT
jgi:hypothetical protein